MHVVAGFDNFSSTKATLPFKVEGVHFAGMTVQAKLGTWRETHQLHPAAAIFQEAQRP
ncbi:hypothetical protein PQR12_10090 [Paraburkholderia nemoris]